MAGFVLHPAFLQWLAEQRRAAAELARARSEGLKLREFMLLANEKYRAAGCPVPYPEVEPEAAQIEPPAAPVAEESNEEPEP